MEAATAQIAFFGPRRARRRWNWACRELAFWREAAQAHCTRVVFSQGAPWRRRVERRLPALSSLRGHRPAQDSRCPALGKRRMAVPISATITSAPSALTPGMELSSRTAARKGSDRKSTRLNSSHVAISYAVFCLKKKKKKKRTKTHENKKIKTQQSDI